MTIKADLSRRWLVNTRKGFIETFPSIYIPNIGICFIMRSLLETKKKKKKKKKKREQKLTSQPEKLPSAILCMVE